MGIFAGLFRPVEPKGGAGLASALFRLLDETEQRGAPSARGRRRRGDVPELPALTSARWAEAAAAAKPDGAGELVALRSELAGVSVSFLDLAPRSGEREVLLGAAAAVAELIAAGSESVAGGEESADASILTVERALPPALALLRGRVGGGRFFSARGGSVLVHVEESAALAVEAALAADPSRLDSPGSGDLASLRLPSTLAVGRSQDFVLSRFFLPPLFPAASASSSTATATDAPPPLEIAAFWDEIAVGRDPLPGSLWFAGSVGDPKAGLVLAYECPVPSGADRQAYAARVLPVLRAGWARAARSLAAFAPAACSAEPRFGRLGDAGAAAAGEAPEALLRGALRVMGDIRLGLGGFPLAVYLPPRFVSILAEAAQPRPETPGAEGSALAELLSVNEALLARWSPGHRDEFLKPRPIPGALAEGIAAGDAPVSTPPLAPLFAALGRRDAAVAMQNCIIPSLGSKELAYLFYYRASFVRDGKRETRPYPVAPFREGDVTRLLPAAAREEWEYERGRGLPRHAASMADCVAAGEAAAGLIWDAVRKGKIELSPGSRELLETSVGARLAAAARGKLESLAARDVPFGFLASLGRRDARRIVDKLSNRELALASVGDRRHVELLRSAMSRGRQRDFGEELAIAEARIERGEASPEAASAMKLSLLERMKEYAEALRREDATRSEAGGTKRPVAPRR